MQINENTCVQIFYKMMKSRLFEELCVQLKDLNIINDKLYLSYGQEAVAASVCALGFDDMIFASHRSSTIAISANVSAEKLFAEAMGLDLGLNSGRCGLSQICDKNVNFISDVIPANSFAKAVGAALALKIKQKNNAVICYAGDGAAMTGNFFEALNLSALKKLPIVFYIENNGYAQKSPQSDYSCVKDIYQLAKGLNITGILTDGNSPVDVYTATLQALEFAKQTSSPVIVEAKTYRLSGHFYDEIQNYRSEKEMEKWLEYDPIENHTNFMLKNKMGEVEDFINMRSKIKEELDTALDNVLNTLSKPNSEELQEAQA